MFRLIIWKDVKNYEGLYQVNNYGQVKSLRKGKILRTFKNGKTTHQALHLANKDKVSKKEYIHRLVAFAFPEICGEWFEGAEVNHLDENPLNNTPANLRWTTHRDNNLWGTKIERQRQKMIGCPFYGNQYVKNGITLPKTNGISAGSI